LHVSGDTVYKAFDSEAKEFPEKGKNIEGVDEPLVASGKAKKKEKPNEVIQTLGLHKCHICSNTFLGMQFLEEHLRNWHHNKTLKCEFCSRIFSKVSYLKEHVNMFHYNAPKTLHECALCGMQFKYKSTLETHNRRVRCMAPTGSVSVPGDTDFLTPSTKKAKIGEREEGILTKNMEKQQRREIREEKYRRTTLKVDDHLTTDNGLQVGSQSGQAGIILRAPKPVQYDKCGTCKKSFTLSDLSKHMADGCIKPRKCYLCQKEFYVLLDLERHMTTHTALERSLHLNSNYNTWKTYKCDSCGRCYTQAKNRDKHMAKCRCK
jgi:KRAB domain-containing zinc finger protein